MAIPAVIGTATGGRNGAGGFSVAPPAGAAGYVAVCGFLVGSGVSTPLTAPAGWTLHASGANSAADVWSRWQIWVGTAGAGSSWTFATSGDAIETVAMTMIGLDGPVTVDVMSATNLGNASGSFTGSSPSVTTTEPGLVVRALTGNPWRQDIAAEPHTTTYPSGSTLARNRSLVIAGAWDGAYAGTAAAEQPTPGASGTASWTVSVTGYGGFAAPIAITLAIRTDAGPAGLDGAGTLTVTGVVDIDGQAGLSGGGVLAVQPPGGVVLSGSGQLDLAAGLSATGQAALAGDGLLVSAGEATGVASVSLTGAGALATAGTPGTGGTVGLTGSGVLQAGGVSAGQAGLSGDGGLGVDSTVHVTWQAGFGGGGVLAAGVIVGVTGQAGFGGGGVLVADRLGLAVVALAGEGSLQLVGLVPPVRVRKKPRIRLQGSRARVPGPTVRLGGKATIMVDGSCCGCDTPPGPDPTLTEFTLRARDRDGYDDDGNPQFRWVDVLTGPALEWSTRTEIDQTAGITRVTADLVMANPAGVTIQETGIAVSGGMVWSITKTVPGPAGIKLRLLRLDHDE